MWAFRRASIHLRIHCLGSCAFRICSVESEVASSYLVNYNAEFSLAQSRTRFHNTHISSKSLLNVQSFSSLAGANSSEDSDELLRNALTRIETRNVTIQEAVSGNNIDDESISGSEPSVSIGVADDISELHLLESVSDAGEEISLVTEARSGLINAILSSSWQTVSRVLDEWVEAGNKVTQTEVSCIMLILYRRRMFGKALEVSEWLESRDHLEFTESDYARRIDLVAKIRGIYQAEQYLLQIPESYRREIVYSGLLKNYVAASNVRKSEKLFNTMKNSFPLTSISCNQLLFLYKKTNRKKIDDVLSLMKNANIKMLNATYQILIDVKGQSYDISGMEQLFETMKSDGVEPSSRNLASLAQYYAARGCKAKAQAVLKDIEGGDLIKNRPACRSLLLAYAKLGRDDEVERIWKECEPNPSIAECIVAIKAWGALKRIEEAEAAFDKILKTLKSPISKHYTVLLDVYAAHKMLAKGEDLLRRMTEGGATVRGEAWDAIVKLYVGVGDVEKADAILEKLIRQRRERPRAKSFLNILDEYARRGDVANAEKIFSKMRNAGYGVEPRPYHSLLYAYINAKASTDRFEERLRRDGIVPDQKLHRLLARAAA